MSAPFLDRAAVRALVEEHWRSLLATARASPETAQGALLAFEQRIQAIAATMPPAQAQVFLAAIDAERARLDAEYWADPAALKRRLGLAPDTFSSRGGSGIGRMVVRTAVRATVWELVYSMLRLFR